MSSVVAGDAPLINLAEDLEDGEIDDDDEDEQQQQKPPLPQQQQQQQIQAQKQSKPVAFKGCGSNDEVQFVGIERLSEKHDDDVIFLGMASETAVPNNSKSKKPRPLEGKHQWDLHIFIALFCHAFSNCAPFPTPNTSTLLSQMIMRSALKMPLPKRSRRGALSRPCPS